MTDETGTEGGVPGLDASDEAEPASRSSQSWLDAIRDAEKAFKTYQDKSDSVDKEYANLERLAGTTRDREIQLFWANISVMGPSVYSRPPVPVVIGRWKQRDELIRTTSEMLERATIVTFEKEDIDGVMRLIRDDLVILARGVPWCRLAPSQVCIDHADRKDFLHEAARNWKEVDWVAKRSWLTKKQAKKRFEPNSKEAYKGLQYAIRKDGKSDSDDGEQKAGIWELWCKSANKVVWISEGAEEVLDQGKPHLKLEGFFPCPKPAFGTLQRRSLVPVPDMVFYKDQLEEINEITARIAALVEAVKVRGFYSSGAGEIGDAVEAAFKNTSNNTVLVPIANLAGLSGVALKDAIAWLPIDVITATITAIIAVRKQLIDDVYQVTGLSDIMRGESEASETLGAQQLKSNFGQVRIKDKQDELTRLARDVTRIVAEVIAENFSGEELMEMTQMRLPSDADVEKQAAPLQAQLKELEATLPGLDQQLQALQVEIQHAQSDPEIQQLAASNPDQAKQILGQVQQQMQVLQQKVQQGQQQAPVLEAQLKTLSTTVTIDKVMKLLQEQKLRPFILDIETDSTIAPDENASKQRATEFVTAVGGYMKEALPLIQTMPQASAVVAETLKFVTGQYRAGRELEGVIDKFADDMEAKAQQPAPPNPEAIKAQSEAQQAEAKQAQEGAAAQAKIQLETAAQQASAQQAAAQQQIDAQAAQDAHALAQQKLHLDAQVAAAKTAETSQKHALDHEKTMAAAAESQQKHDLEMRKAELASLTSIEVAQIGAKETVDAIALTKALEADFGFKKLALDHEHQQNMATADQTHQQTMAAPDRAAADASAAKDKTVSEAHDVKPHLEKLMTSTADMHEKLQGLLKSHEAPIEILYGTDGKVSGRKIGDRIQMIQRRKDA